MLIENLPIFENPANFKCLLVVLIMHFVTIV